MSLRSFPSSEYEVDAEVLQLLRYSRMRRWESRLSWFKLLNEAGLTASSCAVNWMEDAMQLDHRDKTNFDGFWISRSNRARGYSTWPCIFKSARLSDLSFEVLIKRGAYQGSSCAGNNIVSTRVKKEDMS